MKKRDFQRLLKDLPSWIEDPANKELLLDRTEEMLGNFLQGKEPSPGARLEEHGWWDGNYGACLVLKNDPEGWKFICNGFQYRVWYQRLLCAMLDAKSAKSLALDKFAFLIIHAMFSGNDAIADWLGNRVITSFQKKDKRIGGWGVAPFYPFAVKLYANWRNIPLDYSERDVTPLGVYLDVLNNWQSEKEFAKALLGACDYHVEQAFDVSDNDPQDFNHPLYCVFPVEILAIGRIRREQGLPMPKIDHPLMNTPLAHPPDLLPKVEDELLGQVIAEMRRAFSITEPWK